MYCPSCGKEVQEGNLFCPFCGKALSSVTPSPSPSTSSQPSQPYQTTPQRNSTMSHTARNVAIAIAVLLVIIIAVVVAVSLMNSNGGSIIPTTHTTNIVNGLVTVNANSYEYYTFTVPSGASNIQVSGSFTASGGSGNDIKVYVFDQSDFVNWQNGHAASAYYQSGQTTTGTISATLPSSGTYVLVYDNTFSIISQKNVNTEADFSYTS